MKVLNALWFSVRSLLRRRRVDADLDEELAFHLDRETALYEQQGMSPDAARREATKHFGGVQRYREECRDVRRVRWLDDLRTDVRFALRLLRHYPGFGANVILISALGIGACATTFSIVSGILLSPLPFATPERVAELELVSSEGGSATIPIGMYRRIAAGSPVIEAIAAYESEPVTIELNGEPQRLRADRVTSSFFPVFGLRPLIGRAFSDQEGAEQSPVVVVGYETWRTAFNADPALVGKQLSLNGSPHTVIGVMLPKFRAHFAVEPALWLPLRLDAPVGTPARVDVNALLRLRAGVTLEQAQAWLAGAIREKVESRASSDSLPAVPGLTPITDLVYGTVQRPLVVLLGAVLLVLLLVSANVATMFLARSATRGRELGVRRALGASAGRELRQLVTESVTLTALGGVLGVVASYWGVALVRGLGFRVLPRIDDVALDWRVLMFAVAAMMFTGVVGGLAPMLSSRDRLFAGGIAGAGSRVTGTQRLSSALVVVQIALSVVLLVGSGLLIKGFQRIASTDPGFALDNRATISVDIGDLAKSSAANRAASRQFVQTVADRMRRVDGVRDVAAALVLPFTGTTATTAVGIAGRPNDGKPLRAFQNIVTANYLDVMRIPVRAGRGFSTADVDGADRVAIVNETAAAAWWPNAGPVGHELTVGSGRNAFNVTIVGVVRDARMFGKDTKLRPEIYLPLGQQSLTRINFVVRTTVAPHSVSRELKHAVWSVAPTLPMGMTDLAAIASISVSRPRFFSTVMGLFAAAAVTLSALGVYSLLAFAVTQRRREIGIRIALGAPARRIGSMILGRALLLGASGVAIGVVLARLLSRYMESLLIETSATDGTVFTSAAVGVLVLAVIAACMPARQALKTDPMTSLRV